MAGRVEQAITLAQLYSHYDKANGGRHSVLADNYKAPTDYQIALRFIEDAKANVGQVKNDPRMEERWGPMRARIAPTEAFIRQRMTGGEVDFFRAMWPTEVGPVDEELVKVFRGMARNRDTSDHREALDAGWRTGHPQFDDKALNQTVVNLDVDGLKRLFASVSDPVDILWLERVSPNGNPVARVLRGPASLDRARMLMYLMVSGAALEIRSGTTTGTLADHPRAKEFDFNLLRIVEHPMLVKANARERERNKRAVMLGYSRSRFQADLAAVKSLLAQGTFDGAWRAFLVTGEKAHFQTADRLARSDAERRKMEYAAIIAAGPDRVFDIACKDMSTAEKWTSGRQLFSDGSGGTRLTPRMDCRLGQRANAPLALRHAYDVDIAGTVTVRKSRQNLAVGGRVDEGYVEDKVTTVRYPSFPAATITFEATDTTVSRVIYGEAVTTSSTEGVSMATRVKTIRTRD
ncbi:MAG: hypothetical protein HY985_05605 [Magnetospirillum sp.]|nr:hypothetical protein [Magnetospirillum sp.]